MKCPTCRKPSKAYEDGNRDWPFCCDRCKLIDLGNWLDGNYQIPVEDDDDEQREESPADPGAPRDPFSQRDPGGQN